MIEQNNRYCTKCQDMVSVVTEKPLNHVLHFLLSIFTFGWWTWVWLFLGLGSVFNCRCEDCGTRILPFQKNKMTDRPIQPLASATAIFDTTKLVPPTQTPPTPVGEWKSINSDHKTLQNYAAYLDNHKTAVETVAETVVRRFRKDHKNLIRQQHKIIQRALDAQNLIKRFHELPDMQISSSNVPQIAALTLPKTMPYHTPKEFAKQYSLVPHQMGASIGRMINNGTVSNHPVAAIAALVIGSAIAAVNAKKTITQATRALEEGYSVVSRFSMDLNTTAALLGRCHQEMVRASEQLKKADDEICTLIAQAQAISKDSLRLIDLEPESRQVVENLYFWSMAADQLSRQAI